MKKIILLSLLFFSVQIITAQQYPLFSNYVLNSYGFNPAIAGSSPHWDARATYRTQWVGIDGAPQTQIVSLHGPVGAIGVGGYFFNDSAGKLKRTGGSGTLTYGLRFGNTGEGWQFDLLLGSIWDDILEICNTAISVDDLGYEDEQGKISGEDVIRDILKQGAELNIELHEEEKAEEDNNAFELANDGYDYGRYRDTHEYVKPVRKDTISRDTYRKYRDPDYHSPVWKRRRWYDDWDD